MTDFKSMVNDFFNEKQENGRTKLWEALNSSYQLATNRKSKVQPKAIKFFFNEKNKNIAVEQFLDEEIEVGKSRRIALIEEEAWIHTKQKPKK